MRTQNERDVERSLHSPSVTPWCLGSQCPVVMALDDADALAKIISDAIDQLEFEGNTHADTIRLALSTLRGERTMRSNDKESEDA